MPSAQHRKSGRSLETIDPILLLLTRCFPSKQALENDPPTSDARIRGSRFKTKGPEMDVYY
jgi:hypothetical protein